MESPTVGAVAELVFAVLAAHCASLPPKARVAFVRHTEEAFETSEACEAISLLIGPRTPVAQRRDRRLAHAMFKEALPRLVAP